MCTDTGRARLTYHCISEVVCPEVANELVVSVHGALEMVGKPVN